MAADVKLAHIASLLADPTRARIVMALMDGRARTAKELAFLSGVSAATASAHLAKLVGTRLVQVSPQGRHRYHRIASPLVAEMVEAIGAVAGETLRADPVRGPADAAMLTARTCYDHLAGRLGVAIADALQEAGHVALTGDGGEVTGAAAPSSPTTASTSIRRGRRAASSAAPASTGPSAASTSPATSAR